ncbi:MAG: methyltransferase domain-containing protein [Candidatus Diapherotrites archaeon]
MIGRKKPKKEIKKPKFRKADIFIWPWIAPAKRHRGPYFRLVREIASLLEIKKGDRVLETHCGIIPHFRVWKAAVGKEGRMIAIDLDPFAVRASKAIESVYTRKKNRTDIRVADAENLPFPDKSFNKYIMVFPDELTEKVMSEMYRVLEPGGLAFIKTDPDEIFDALKYWGFMKKFKVLKSQFHSRKTQSVVLKKI